METPTISLLFFSLLFFATTLPPPAVSVCNSHDKAVLLKIKEEFSNPYVLASWKSSINYCKEWYAVKCNTTTHRITVISLQYDDNLSDQIPTAAVDGYFYRISNTTVALLAPESWLSRSFSQQAYQIYSSELRDIDLNHNRIYGKLPEGLTELPNLLLLNVSYSRLCGQIPVGGSLQSFDQYNYLHNKCLCGNPLPACKQLNIPCELITASRGKVQ
ncbi:hypothetical protein Nepgr_031209 [Nepenthes gracilis]|uniref:Leucine-rich repeat-containing N-terminal plant-type domain-containing protein n=1 Tax=Nepenthes gracilis TaxID=150966 RepID=A0AAD3THP4_NEPGR|nr:hypothetical protein Nepgr_031209 [Nepenthes gracilis]